jgi:hypothetical protein
VPGRRNLGGLLLLWMALSLACSQTGAGDENTGVSSVKLAEMTKNGVSVTINLETDGQGDSALLATFSPLEEDTHLYSMDLPMEGVDGLGRPTRLELAPGVQMQASGSLEESTAAQSVEISPDLPILPVYPAGPVTLRLPVTLPEGTGGSFSDRVLVTYMACTVRGCLRPVINEAIELRVRFGP